MRRNLAQRLIDHLLAGWKFLLSFRKSDWTIADYPISMRKQNKQLTDLPRDLKTFAFVAQVIKWPTLFGGGATEIEAMQNLRQDFLKRRTEMSTLPRRGRNVPIHFASCTRVNRHADLARDFTRSVLQLPWAFLSDESSLWDFSTRATASELVLKIREVYRVDVSDIANGNVADILERTAASRNQRSHIN